MKKLLFLVGFLAVLHGNLLAQVLMSSTGSTTQNFNTLTTSTTATTWTDNSTIANWYSQRTGNGTTYKADAGLATAGGLYSYGASGNSDRAIGTLGSSNAAAGSFAHGVLLKNTSGVTITDIKVTYTLEQWRNSAAAAQSITVYYKISSSTITSLNPNANTGWTQVTALALASPITGGTAGQLDGNATANRVTATNVSIPSLSIPADSYIMIKWEDPDHSGTDHGLAIDDVTINWTVPRPSTQTSSIIFPGTQSNQMQVNWTNGDGAKRVVYINTTNSFTDPTDGMTDPTANTVYAGSGQQCVFNGTSGPVTVTGLSASTTYWFRAYEYNGSGSTSQYLVTTATNNPNSQATTSGAQPYIETSVGSLTGFTQTDNVASTSQSYTVSAIYLEDDVAITASDGFQVSDNNADWKTQLTLTPTSGDLTATVYVRMNASAAGNITGTITHSSVSSNTPVVNVSGFRTANFYSKATGNLDDVASWTNNSDGSAGTAPVNFTTAGQIFHIKNRSTSTIASSWTVSGSTSKIIVGDGTTSTTFTIPDPATVTGTIDITANAKLELASNTTPTHTYGTVDAASTIEFSNAPTGGYTIPQITYGNLILKNGIKKFLGNTTTVAGSITFDATNYDGSSTTPFSTINWGGNMTYLNSVTPPVAGNSITLIATGTGVQTITGNGNEVRFFRLQTSNATSQIILASGTSDNQTNLTLGNTSGGGLTLATSSTLTLNNNTLTFFDGKPSFIGSGTISGSAAASMVLNTAYSTSTNAGVFYFTEGAQVLKDLTINNHYANGYFTLGSNLTVNNSVTMTAGLLLMGASANLTLASAAAISSSATSFISFNSASTGQLKKEFTSAGTFTFPVGDNTGTIEYSPAVVNLTSGTFSSGSVGVSLKNAKYSVSNPGSTNYLSRYWTISAAGITDYSANVTLSYTAADVTGSESLIYGGKYNGSSWLGCGKVNSTLHQISVDGLTSLGDFTGGDPTIVAANNICIYDITVNPEGYYTDGVADFTKDASITVELHNTTAPYGLVDQASVTVDKTTHTAKAGFLNTANGTYYIVVKGSSLLETWSKASGEPFTIGSTGNYDFTTAATQAYGSNMIQKGTKWCIYSGDVNQDGKIDYTDFRTVDVDVQAHTTGTTVNDINGDGLVDFTDIKIVDNNSHNNVQVQKPTAEKTAAPKAQPETRNSESDTK